MHTADNVIPINSQVDFGMRTPTFGRTEYFLGDVVLTCQFFYTNCWLIELSYQQPEYKKCEDKKKGIHTL